MACRYSFSAAENCFCAKYWFPFSTRSLARAELRQAGRRASVGARTNIRAARRPKEKALRREEIIFISGSASQDHNQAGTAVGVSILNQKPRGLGLDSPSL